MAFTAQELVNITSAALDFHMSPGEVLSSTLQNKPFLKAMLAKKKFFPSSNEKITLRVKGDYTTTIQGYTHDDVVTYKNPANIKTASFAWKEIHAGISITHTELKRDGISIINTTDGTGESRHSGREVTALANLLDDKLEDMKEGTERGLNNMYWADGTQDAKLIAGIKSLLVDNPTNAVSVGGIDQVANTWWRNRSNLAIAAINAAPDNQVLVNFLQSELRQLRKFGSPEHMVFCGSAFLNQLERELRAKGNYTLEGWNKGGSIDISMNDIKIKNLEFVYDPTLDDRNESDRCYFIDMKAIKPMFMEGEYMKKHAPARPEDRYVLYKAVTITGALCINQRNTSGVYRII